MTRSQFSRLLAHSVILVAVWFFCVTSSQAQEREDAKPPVSRWSVGIGGGWMQTIQSGSFRTPCGCGSEITNSGRSDPNGSFFVQFRADDELRIGLKSVLTPRSFYSSLTKPDSVIGRFRDPDSVGWVHSTIQYITTASVTFVSLRPFVRFYPASKGFYVSAEPGFDFRQYAHIKVTRTAPASAIFVFENGTHTETLQDGAIEEAHALGFSATITAGYEIELLAGLFVAPVLAYTKSFSTITDKYASYWKADAVSIELSLRYDL